MKMVEDMHGVRAVFKYGGDESGREIGGDILDVELLSSDPFPKSGQSIGRLALTHMENPPALEVNDNGFVHMPFFERQTRLCRCCPLPQERAEHIDTQDDECESL